MKLIRRSVKWSIWAIGFFFLCGTISLLLQAFDIIDSPEEVAATETAEAAEMIASQATVTVEATETATESPSETPEPTIEETSTETFSPTPSPTSTITPTDVSTSTEITSSLEAISTTTTPTQTATPTLTITSTLMPSPTATDTATLTATATITDTPSPTETNTPRVLAVQTIVITPISAIIEASQSAPTVVPTAVPVRPNFVDNPALESDISQLNFMDSVDVISIIQSDDRVLVHMEATVDVGDITQQSAEAIFYIVQGYYFQDELEFNVILSDNSNRLWLAKL